MFSDLIGFESPSPRHPQMEDQCIPAISVDQAIFGAPPKAGNRRAGKALAQVDRYRAPEIGPSRLDRDQATPFQYRLKTAHGRFNFGKFWHQKQLSCVCGHGKAWLEDQAFPSGG